MRCRGMDMMILVGVISISKLYVVCCVFEFE